jgi:hypothetical protein
MELFPNFYPGLDERLPLPIWYTPLVGVLFACAPLITNRLVRHSTIFPLLLILAIGSPYFTRGNVSDDYGRGFPVLHFVLEYLDLYIITPTEGEEIGIKNRQLGEKGGKAITEDDCTTPLEKLKWGGKLL